jgi:hypothetical protein
VESYWQGKPKFSAVTYHSATSSPTNPTWTVLGLNHGLRYQRPEDCTCCLYHQIGCWSMFVPTTRHWIPETAIFVCACAWRAISFSKVLVHNQSWTRRYVTTMTAPCTTDDQNACQYFYINAAGTTGVFNPWFAKLCYAARGHICKRCVYNCTVL